MKNQILDLYRKSYKKKIRSLCWEVQSILRSLCVESLVSSVVGRRVDLECVNVINGLIYLTSLSSCGLVVHGREKPGPC